MREDNLLKMFFEERIGGTLEESICNDEDYSKSRKYCKKALKKLEKLDLSTKQKRFIDRAVSATNGNGAAYGRAAYRQGFQDGLRMLIELEQLTMGDRYKE